MASKVSEGVSKGEDRNTMHKDVEKVSVHSTDLDRRKPPSLYVPPIFPPRLDHPGHISLGIGLTSRL